MLFNSDFSSLTHAGIKHLTFGFRDHAGEAIGEKVQRNRLNKCARREHKCGHFHQHWTEESSEQEEESESLLHLNLLSEFWTQC